MVVVVGFGLWVAGGAWRRFHSSTLTIPLVVVLGLPVVVVVVVATEEEVDEEEAEEAVEEAEDEERVVVVVVVVEEVVVVEVAEEEAEEEPEGEVTEVVGGVVAPGSLDLGYWQMKCRLSRQYSRTQVTRGLSLMLTHWCCRRTFLSICQ